MFCDYQFVRPSFVEGMARVLDIGGTLQEYSAYESAAEADYNAIASDWKVVMGDFGIASWDELVPTQRPVASESR